MKGFGRNSRQKVHPNFAQNLGRQILGIPFLLASSNAALLVHMLASQTLSQKACCGLVPWRYLGVGMDQAMLALHGQAKYCGVENDYVLGFIIYEIYTGKKKACTALLQWGTFFAEEWGSQRKDFGGRYGFPWFYRVFVSTTGLESFSLGQERSSNYFLSVVVVYVFSSLIYRNCFTGLGRLGNIYRNSGVSTESERCQPVQKLHAQNYRIGSGPKCLP